MLGLEAEGDVLCLSVHHAWHHHFHIHAAVVAQDGRLCRVEGERRERGSGLEMNKTNLNGYTLPFKTLGPLRNVLAF